MGGRFGLVHPDEVTERREGARERFSFYKTQRKRPPDEFSVLGDLRHDHFVYVYIGRCTCTALQKMERFGQLLNESSCNIQQNFNPPRH